MLTAVILNDTRYNVGHIGCQVVMQNLFELLLQNDIRVSTSFSPKQLRRRPALARGAIDRADAVIINGEGTFHDSRPACIALLESAEYAKRQGVPVYLVNALWQNNRQIESYLESIERIYTRDTRSARELAGCHPHVEMVPDLSFALSTVSLQTSWCEGGRPLVVDSVYRDRALNLAEYARRRNLQFKHMGIAYPHKTVLKHVVRPAYVGRLLSLSDIARAEYIITGRFHAITLACCFGVPFISVPSNSHKIEALLEDMGLGEETYLCQPDRINEIDVHVEKVRAAWLDGDGLNVEAFVKESDRKIKRMFQSIRADLAERFALGS